MKRQSEKVIEAMIKVLLDKKYITEDECNYVKDDLRQPIEDAMNDKEINYYFGH